VESPVKYKKELVTLFLPTYFYDYVVNQEQILICELNEENMEIALNMKIEEKTEYIISLNKNENTKTKSLYITLEKNLLKEEIHNLLIEFTKTAYAYINCKKKIILKLIYIPENLIINNFFLYENEFYFLQKFIITKEYCTLFLYLYENPIIQNKSIENFNDNEVDNKQFIYMENEKLFIVNKHVKKKMEKITLT
jgi:hypothetical protein